jgi:hypothetical protein
MDLGAKHGATDLGAMQAVKTTASSFFFLSLLSLFLLRRHARRPHVGPPGLTALVNRYFMNT